MTKIQWTERTWNPILGCSKVSEGCQNCYAIASSKRVTECSDKGRSAYHQGLTVENGNRLDWSGKVVFVPEALDFPYKRKKGSFYFVNSMSDLFHERVKNEWIERILAVIKDTPHHTYQLLTKRPERMLSFFENRDILPNLWLGVSVESQRRADERIPILKQTKASIRFLSCEPLLESVNLGDLTGIAWVIVGGESGVNARPFDIDWGKQIINQCQSQGVKVFFKQAGRNVFFDGMPIKLKSRKGDDLPELPASLNIREMP